MFDSALRIFDQADCPNLLIGIPGTTAGIAAIEDCIDEGVPVNVTMLFSGDQYLAAAGAYYRGITRRLRRGLHPHIASVASVSVSPWDSVMDHEIAIAMGGRIDRCHLAVLASRRWAELADRGAHSQRLHWTDPDSHLDASDTRYTQGEALLTELAATGVDLNIIAKGLQKAACSHS